MTIEAYIASCSTVSAAATGADAVSVTSLDNSFIHSQAYAISAAVGIAPASLALAVGVVLAQNEIGNVVEAYIGSTPNTSIGPDLTTVTSAGGVEIFATSTSNIKSDGVAVAFSVSLVGLSGSGGSATNTTNNTISAFVQNGSTVDASGKVQITAKDNATIDSTVGTAAISVAVVAVSVGVSPNNSTIGDTVAAYVTGATVTTTGGDVDITATSNATIGGEAVATSVAVGIGGSGAGGESSSIDNVVTLAYVGSGATISTGGGQLNIHSTAMPNITAEADGGSAGLVSVGVMESTATLDGATRAYIGGGVTITAGGVDVSAMYSNGGGANAVAAKTTLVNIGAVALSLTTASASIGDKVEAFIAPDSNSNPTVITVTGGTLDVKANSTTTADVEAPGGSAAGISITSTTITSNVDGATNAYIGGHVTLNVPTATVSAQSTNTATTNATMVAIAAVAANVGQVESENSRGVSAFILGGANVQAPNTNLSLQATSTENANTTLNGGDGGVLAISVLIAQATVSGTTEAFVGARATVAASSLGLHADVQAANAINHSFLLSLGLLAGDGSDSNASVSGSSQAFVGDNTTLTIGGPVTVQADSSTTPSDQVTVAAGGGLAIGGATVNANDSETTSAFVGTSAVVNAGGPVSFEANAVVTPTISVTVGAGGLLSGAGADATINDTTTTQAYVGNGSFIGSAAHPSGSVTITATSIDQGNNNVSAGSGGILTGNGSTVDTNIKPMITAYVDQNASIDANGSVTVTATSTRAEGHSTGSSISVGGAAVGAPGATATTAPVITGYLAKGSSIIATGSVTVEAIANDTPSQPFTDLIQGVDPSTGTITFPSHGLIDGDLVQYNPNGDAKHPFRRRMVRSVRSRDYRVIVTGPDTLKLGASFQAVSIIADPLNAPVGVDPTKNVIEFAGPDQFVTGDAVHYDPDGGGSISTQLTATGTYFVRVINPNTIKLYTTHAAAIATFDSFDPSSSSNVSSNTFNFNDKGFTLNELVTYEAPAPQAFAGGAVVNGNQIKVTSTSSFHTGDQVIYRTNAPSGTVPIAPLVNGGTYFVIVVDGTTLELDASRADATSAHSSPISLTPVSNSPFTEQVQQPAIGGLVDGDTYFVVNPRSGSFQLSSTSSGSAISLTTSGTSGLHQIGPDGIQFG